MALYLLDTNIVSDLVRRPQGVVAQRIGLVGEREIATSIIVAAELAYGARKRGTTRLSEQLARILSRMEVLPLVPPADQHYAKLRAELEANGAPIGANDMLIAAHALSLGMVLVSANLSEFTRVPDLKIENWLDA